jgi:multiple sugar transport system substrate-binding protein
MEMSMFIKRVSLVVVAMLLLFSFVACSTAKDNATKDNATKENASEEKVKIVWQSWDPIGKYQPIIDAYQKLHPSVTIEYQQVADYLTKIFTEASSDTLPDLISCQVGFTQQFADAGIVEKIDIEKLKANQDFKFDDFWETTLSYSMYQGEYYGLPVDGGNYAYIYNKKIFDEVGITVPNEGFSWDEFVEVGKKLVKKDANGKVVRYATMMNDLGFKFILPLIWQNGGQYLNEDGTKCLLDQPKAIEAIQWVKDLYTEHGVMPPLEKVNEGTLPIVGMLNSGTIAMGRVGLWETLKLKDSDILDWKIMPAPYGKGGHGEVLYVNTLSISSKSKNKQAAMDFLLFVCSQEGLRILLENTSDPQIAVRKSLKNVAITPLPKGKNAEVYMDSLEYCKWMPNVLSVNKQLDIATQGLDRIWYNNEPIDKVMSDVTKQIDQLLK